MKKISFEEVVLNELNRENDWRELSRYYDLSEEIIDNYIDKIKWVVYTRYHFRYMDRRLLKKYKDRLDWDYISRRCDIDRDFLEEFKYELDWEILYSYRLPRGFSIEF